MVDTEVAPVTGVHSLVSGQTVIAVDAEPCSGSCGKDADQ